MQTGRRGISAWCIVLYSRPPADPVGLSIDGVFYRCDDRVGFPGRKRQWRRDYEDVAEPWDRVVGASDEDVLFAHGLLDAYDLRIRHRGATVIGYHFAPGQQAAPAHFADRRRLQGPQPVHEVGSNTGRIFPEPLPCEYVQI